MNPIELGAEALWSLTLISALAGLATVFVFRRWSDQRSIRSIANRMLAHLMEFRLFIDEPALVIRAQRDLFVDNWHLLRALIRPSLILVIPFVLLLAQMEAYYGRAPLRIGDPAVVTVQFKSSDTAPTAAVMLKAAAAIKVETPGVRIVALNQVSWRIRPIEPSSGQLRVIEPGRVVTKAVFADHGMHYVTRRRVSSLAAFSLDPQFGEPPFADSSVDWVEVLYPSATILHLHWLIWFLLVSSAAAILSYAVPGVVKRIMARP